MQLIVCTTNKVVECTREDLATDVRLYRMRRSWQCVEPYPLPSAAAGSGFPSLSHSSSAGKTTNGEEFLEFATALNLSAGGVLLAARRYMDPGSEITLEIPVALANKAQLPRSVSLLQATVLRCTADRQYFFLGIQFREPLLGAADRTGIRQGPHRRESEFPIVKMFSHF